MFDLSRLFKTPIKRVPNDIDAIRREDQRKVVTEEQAVTRAEAALKQLQHAPHLLTSHTCYVQALLDLLAIQLRQSERAVVRALPNSQACGAVQDTRAKLEQGLTAAWQLVDWNNSSSVDTAPGAAPVSFQALYNSPSILGAMQFCRYFTSAAGLAVLHMAVNAYQLPPPRHQQAKMHHKQQQDHGEPQRQLQRPFTLVVDVKGTGHVTSLQAALDMAATAAAQGAQQHYCGSVQEADAPQKVAGYGSSRSTEPSRDAEQANDDDCSSSDIASENMLIVLLPGTYPGNYTLPCTIKHITVAGAPGPKALLCQPSSEPDSSSQYHQQLLQSLDARVQQLRLREQQNAPLMRAVSDTARQKQQQTLGGCLLACPFGVTYVKLQNLHMQMAGAAAGSGAAQFQTMLLRQDSAPASFGRGSDSNKSSGCGDGGSSEPYCIRLSAGCELRLEWCEFSGGAGAVSCEPGAMVTAMQCNFHQ